METMILTPYVGIDRILFSASENECEKIFGSPVRRAKTRRNETKLIYEEIEFTFPADGSRILEMSFRQNVKLILNEIDVLHDKATLSKLKKLDNPLEYVGILFFPALGISATGLHNQDDLCVTAISRGRFDKIVSNFLPYRIPDLA